jgi:plastocyanin
MLLLFPLAALLGAAVVVLPALAASSEAKIEVAENCNAYPNWQCWTSPGANPKPVALTIAAGTVVTFVDKTSFAANITWTGAAPTCSSTVPVSPAPAATGWEGTCKFEAPGTYQFEDASMYYPKATVDVSAASTTPTGTGPSGTSTTGTTPSGPSGSGTTSGGSGSSTPSGGSAGGASPLGSLFAGGTSSAVELAATQHGQSVRGSVDVSAAAAGGRLEVQLLAARASLASAGEQLRVRVGRVVHAPLHAGTATFTVTLDTRAKRSLRAHGRLALTVRILLSSSHGSSATTTRSVTLRG